MIIRLPYPPSVNKYKTIIRGKMVNCSKFEQFYKECYYLSKKEKWGKFKDVNLSIDIVVYHPDRRKRDLDNLLKATLDSLKYSKIIDDDFFVQKLSISRGGISKPGYLTIDISEIKK